MPGLGYSIARLMGGVWTVAVGLATLQSQSEFWFGALCVTVAAWVVMALDGAFAEGKERVRRSCLTFLVLMAGGLLVGFGPWSDREIRGAYPTSTLPMLRYANDALWPTRCFLLGRRFLGSSDRAHIQAYDAGRNLTMRMDLMTPSRGPVAMEQLVLSLEAAVRDDIRFFSSFKPGYSVSHTVVENSVEVYLDACYLLASLAIAAIGSVGLGWGWRRRSSSDLDEGMD